MTTVFAAIEFESTLYLAEGPLPTRGRPHTPVTNLIQGIWESEPHRARLILRRPVLVDYELSPACTGMIKVAAKRTQRVDRLLSHDSLRRFGEFSFEHEVAALRGNPMELARELKRACRRNSENRFQNDRPVGAVLVGPCGEILSSAHNRNASNRTLHAEVLLVQNYWRRTLSSIPAGSKLYVTLSPCKMCAGMLEHACEDPSQFEVIYDEPDPGPMGRLSEVDFEVACFSG